MKFDIVKKYAGQFLSDHGATILTAGGVIGTVSTAVLSGRASIKAYGLLEDQQNQWEMDSARYAVEHDGVGQLEPLKQTDKLKVVIPVYVPPVLLGTVTVASIVGANMVSAKRAAALAAAYALTDERFAEYRNKVSTKLTGPKQQQVLDELAQDRVNASSPGRDVVIIADGDVLCFDSITGRYFQSTVEKIKRAELEVKEALYNHNSASLSEFYQKIGLKPTTHSDAVGWDIDNPIEVVFSTTWAEERPCVSIDYAILPKPDYHKTY